MEGQKQEGGGEGSGLGRGGEGTRPTPAPQVLSSAEECGFRGSTKSTLRGLAHTICSLRFPAFSSVQWDGNTRLQGLFDDNQRGSTKAQHKGEDLLEEARIMVSHKGHL